MKLGIISDTHGNLDAVDSVLAYMKADLWLHAGDLVPDAAYMEQTYDVATMKVAGNCDFSGQGAPDEMVVEAGGHKIFLTHGHIYGVRFSAEQIVRTAFDSGCDMAVYGHTHVAQTVKVQDGDDVLWLINPGSASRPRDEMRPSFMVAEILPGADPVIDLFRFSSETQTWQRQVPI